MKGQIAQQLEKLKRAALLTDLHLLAWLGYSSLLAVILLAMVFESIFYFSAGVRTFLLTSLVVLAVLLIANGIIFLLLIRYNRIGRYKSSTLARRTGQLVFEKPDAVINALQLERSLSASNSPELSEVFIRRIFSVLSGLDINNIFPRTLIHRWKMITLGLQVFFVIILLFFWTPTSSALYRWAHPGSEFTVPKPFSLISHSGEINILGGENVELIIQSIGAAPDSVVIELQSITASIDDSSSSGAASEYKSIGPESPGLYKLTMNSVYQDYVYRALYPARSFWQAWDVISSESHRISVTDRPIFEDFTITVIPPAYSGLSPQSQKGNQANVQGLKGSTIDLNLRANRMLSSGKILFNQSEIPLTINGQDARGQFTLENDATFSVNINDRKGISNRDPISYHLQIIPDLAPDLKVIDPAPIIELGDDQIIPIHLSISDDYGFSNLQVGYEIQRPSYLDTKPAMAIFTIRDLVPAVLSQEVFSIWDLSSLGLFPEDEVHYHFELYDNDDVSGPKKSVSGNYIARLPSLADLFEAMESGEEDLAEELDLKAEDLAALSDQLEEAKLELLKSDEINWEQQQALKKTLEKAQEDLKEFQQIAEALEQLTESADKHGLFSKDMLDKFNQLQDLISELITPEMMASMEKMNQALENLDTQDLLSSLEDLAANLDQVEQQLDRFIDIFERIRAEQTLDEVRERLEQLLQQQDGLNEEIKNADSETDQSDLARMAFEEERNSQEFENILDVMQDAADAMEQFSAESSQGMEELENSGLAQNTSQELQSSTSELQQQQPGQAQPHSQQALENLQQMQQQLSTLQQQFQNQTVSEMSQRFHTIMRDLLTLSKSQENLGNSTADMSRNSPRLGETATQQQMLRDQLHQIMSALMDLSRETFAITPEIGKAVGMASAQMQEAQGNLEQRNGSRARGHQLGAMESLNEAALAVNQARNNMQQSGSASGFEQFLKQMQQMSAQQQGLNNQGMQMALGQAAAAAQQAMMQKMLQGQQQIRKSLQDMMNEMKQSGNQGLGDMRGISSEMDEVIKDLQRRRYNRQTQERQERILTRMLDSQRSMTQRDFKQERKSQAASPVVYRGPGGLPADLGQRRSLALEALNQAMKSGYSRDYQEMIRRYFNTISQEELPPDRGGQND